MQKALDQMNLQLHHEISDITGMTGLAIIAAILEGKRDPHELASLRHEGIKVSEEVIAKPLVGDYRAEHLFTLDQSLMAYRSYQKLIGECDREIRRRVEKFKVPDACAAARSRQSTRVPVRAGPGENRRLPRPARRGRACSARLGRPGRRARGRVGHGDNSPGTHQSVPVSNAFRGYRVIILSKVGAIGCGMILATAPFAGGQSAHVATGRFDVVSIKPTLREGPDIQALGSVRMMPGSRLVAEMVQLRYFIQRAYGVKPFQLLGGPAWINSAHFDIEAKGGGNPNSAEMLRMMQALLEERFQLKVHREDRELPVYELVAAKGRINPPTPQPGRCASPDPNGGSMPPAPGGAAPCGQVIVAMSPSGAELRGGAVTMPELIRVLANVLGRIVVDKTGFAGKFDVHVQFTPDEALGGLPAPPPHPAGGDPDIHGNIFAAIQDQLGLKLKSAKGPVDVVVIDSVERPTAN
jgi:uncharacterized protein (TIGR03435 family)